MFPLFALASLLPVSLGGLDFSFFGASVLLTFWLTFEAIYLIGLSFLQVRFLSLPYVCAQTARVILLIGVNYFMLATLKLGMDRALLGNLLAATVSGLVASILLFGAGQEPAYPLRQSWTSCDSGLPSFRLPFSDMS